MNIQTENKQLESLENKTRSLITSMDGDDLRNALVKEVLRLANSDSVDMEKAGEEDDYFIPRLLLKVAMENLSAQVIPERAEEKEMVENLRKF